MSTWRDIMEGAEAAKISMLSDRSAGGKKFELLLQQHQGDGMVFFKRGEAYEAIGEDARAADDFRHAMALFPMPYWKRLAKEALQRVSHGSTG